MQYKSTTIAIKNSDVTAINDALANLGLLSNVNEVSKLFGVFIELTDYTNNFKAAKKYLKEHNIDDENPFFNVFDITEYGLQLSFAVSRYSEYLEILEPVVYSLGHYLSLIMQKEILVLFDDGRIPIGLFINGKLSMTFDEFNAEYMRNKSWKPVR